MFAIFITIIVLIIYGSFYPWAFEARQLFQNPFSILLHSWVIDLHGRRFWADVTVNIAIYMPLGMSGYLAFRRFHSKLLEIAAPLLIGVTLSAMIEMAQLFTPHRNCSAVDWTTNIVGTVCGVLAGFVFTKIVDLPANGPLFAVRDRAGVALLFCWVAFLLFPFFPVTALAVWRYKVLALVHGLWFVPIPVFLKAAEWFVVGRLLFAAGADATLGWLGGLLLLIPVQFAIIDHTLIPADFVGPALGCLLFVAFRGVPQADGIAGVLLILAMTVRGLDPFHFDAGTQAFSWIPFMGLLKTAWQAAIIILLEKIFQYGASVWLLGRWFGSMSGATVVVAILLAVIEGLQTRLPGHSSEITDPLLAVLLGLAILVLRRPQQRPKERMEENAADSAHLPYTK